MARYPATYRDARETIECAILNRFDGTDVECLDLELAGVRFRGMSFDDFCVVGPERYSQEQLARFTLNPPIADASDGDHALCDCELTWTMPVELVGPVASSPMSVDLELSLTLGAPAANGSILSETCEFACVVDGQRFVAQADLFEDGLLALQRQFAGRYRFRNCFGCQFADYSPYGNGLFGTMQCHQRHRQAYLNVGSKSEYFALPMESTIQTQETYRCGEFEVRRGDVGYRGSVD